MSTSFSTSLVRKLQTIPTNYEEFWETTREGAHYKSNIKACEEVLAKKERPWAYQRSDGNAPSWARKRRKLSSGDFVGSGFLDLSEDETSDEDEDVEDDESEVDESEVDESEVDGSWDEKNDEDRDDIEGRSDDDESSYSPDALISMQESRWYEVMEMAKLRGVELGDEVQGSLGYCPEKIKQYIMQQSERKQTIPRIAKANVLYPVLIALPRKVEVGGAEDDERFWAYKFELKKHRGKIVREVYDIDRQYLSWLEEAEVPAQYPELKAAMDGLCKWEDAKCPLELCKASRRIYREMMA